MIERRTGAGWQCVRCGVDCLPQELVCPGCGTLDPDLPDGDPVARETAVARSEDWVTRHEPRQVAMQRLAGATFLLGWAVVGILAISDLYSTIDFLGYGSYRGRGAGLLSLEEHGDPGLVPLLTFLVPALCGSFVGRALGVRPEVVPLRRLVAAVAGAATVAMVLGPGRAWIRYRTEAGAQEYASRIRRPDLLGEAIPLYADRMATSLAVTAAVLTLLAVIGWRPFTGTRRQRIRWAARRARRWS